MPLMPENVPSCDTISLMSEVEAVVPLSLRRVLFVLLAIYVAKVVLPTPEGP